MQEDTSNNMNTKAFSWGVSAVTLHEVGKVPPPSARAEAETWKSLYTTLPHCRPAPPSAWFGGLRGVLKVMCSTAGGLPEQLPMLVKSHCCAPPSAWKRSCRDSIRVRVPAVVEAPTFTNHSAKDAPLGKV